MRLILGGSGFIGSNFTQGTKLSGSDVNLLDFNDTLKCFNQYKPDVVIHSACKELSSKLLYKNSADYFDENIRMSINIFKACQLMRVRKLIVIASVNAFFSEQQSLISDSYNHTIKKILSDEYYKQYNLHSKVFFLSNVYGPNYKNSNNGFIPFIIEECNKANKSGSDLQIIGNPDHTRNFIFVNDVINKIESSIEERGHKTIANNNYYSLKHVVDRIVDIMNFKGQVLWQGIFDSVENKNLDLDSCELAHMDFTELDKGLEHTINWYLKNEA